jgi:hypothetical protein
MTDPLDINAFLQGLGATPAPADQPRQSAASRKQQEREAVAEIEKRKAPGEDSGLNTGAMQCRTWEKKRITLNEPGIRNAVGQIERLPEPGESFHSIMGGDFHGFDIIPAMQRLAGAPLAELRIATYSFSLKNILQMAKMIDTGLIEGPVTLVVSLFFAKTDGNVFAKSVAEVTQRGGTLAITRNHAKVIGCQIGETDDFIVCETSANLRSCLSLEQFTLTNSRELYEFHRGWIEHIAANNTPT